MNSTVSITAIEAGGQPSAGLPAGYCLAGAALFGAATVLASKGSSMAYGTLLLMAASVYGFSTASQGSDFGLAMALTGYLFHVLAIRLICDAGKPSPNADRQPKTQWEWLVVATTNPRRVGWDGPSGPSSESRTAFLLRHSLNLAGGLLVLDLCHAYFSTNAWYLYDAPVAGVRIASLPVLEQAAHTTAWVIYAYLLWFLPYEGLAVAAVACGATRPSDWPQLFTGLSEATSISALWGRVWHQTHRQTFVDLSDALCRHIYGSTRPRSAQYLKAALAFGVSAIVHAAGSLALPSDPLTGTRHCHKPAVFFALQFVGVAFERCLARTTSLRLPRWLGHLWLAVWGISTLVLSGWMDDLVGRRSIPPGVESVLLKAFR